MAKTLAAEPDDHWPVTLFRSRRTAIWVGPADLQVIYNIDPQFSGGNKGGGETIVLIEDTNVFDGAGSYAYSQFRSLYMAPGTGTFSQIQPQPNAGPANCGNPGVLGPGGNDVEAMLDIEYASAVAPDADVVIASCTDTLASLAA